MISELLPYYERELLFIRKMASEFGQRYPERAAALKLTRNGCDDPHVERMIEAFALIAGRIQRKIDDEFPEITQALIDLLYPHFLRPVPSMAIVQFEVDPEQSKISTGHIVSRGATAYAEPIAGVQCRFRTAYPTRLWPIGVASASFGRAANMSAGIDAVDAQYAVRIELQSLGAAKLSALAMRDLRFRIGGDRPAIRRKRGARRKGGAEQVDLPARFVDAASEHRPAIAALDHRAVDQGLQAGKRAVPFTGIEDSRREHLRL